MFQLHLPKCRAFGPGYFEYPCREYSKSNFRDNLIFRNKISKVDNFSLDLSVRQRAPEKWKAAKVPTEEASSVGTPDASSG